jgi:hypothetical protein
LAAFAVVVACAVVLARAQATLAAAEDGDGLCSARPSDTAPGEAGRGRGPRLALNPLAARARALRGEAPD